MIPARNEAGAIARTIETLKAQNVPRGQVEIIVVDNGSTDETSAVARAAGADKVVFEATPGTNIARETGRRAAQGDIVAFLDADSAPPEDWLAHIERDLSIAEVVLVSGPYDYGFTGIRKLVEWLYVRCILRSAPAILHFFFRRKAGVIIEGNFAAPKETFEKIGGLPPIIFWGDGPATAMLVTRRVGRIYFDTTLNVKSSPRRYDRDGTIWLTIHYAWAYIKAYFDPKFR